MKMVRNKSLIFLVFVFGIILISATFVSAGWFRDLFSNGKSTGGVIIQPKNPIDPTASVKKTSPVDPGIPVGWLGFDLCNYLGGEHNSRGNCMLPWFSPYFDNGDGFNVNCGLLSGTVEKASSGKSYCIVTGENLNKNYL